MGWVNGEGEGEVRRRHGHGTWGGSREGGGQGRNEGGVVGIDVPMARARRGEGGVDDDRSRDVGCGEVGAWGGRAPRRPSVMRVGTWMRPTPAAWAFWVGRSSWAVT